MGKKNNAAPAAPKAPAQKSNKANMVNNPATATAAAPVGSMANYETYVHGLDPNHQVDLIKIIHEKFDRPNAAQLYGIAEEVVHKIDEATAIASLCILANEVEYAKNPFAIRMHETQLKSLQEISSAVGITFDLSALPAPNEEGVVTIPSTAVQVSEETQKTLKKEHEAAAKTIEIDPTKIENDDQLADALKKIMSTTTNLFNKIQEPIDFYVAVKKIRAEKSENKEDELKAIEAMSRIELFEEITKFLGSAPLLVSSFAQFMYNSLATTKSPVPAFCVLRNSAKNKTTGAVSVDDQAIADYVKIIIKWCVTSKTAEQQNKIATAKADLEVLKKDEKKNKAAIESLNEKIATLEANIKHFDEVLNAVSMPSSDVVNNWRTSYEEKDKNANQIYGQVIRCYYDDIVISEYKHNGVVSNVEQYIGVITNMFRDPLEAIEGYAESNIAPLEPISETTATEKEPKND